MSSNISSISSLAQTSGSINQSQVQEAVQMAMLKKSIDIQAQGILPLIDSLVQNNPAASGSSNLGTAVDVRV